MINRIVFTREMCADPVLNVHFDSKEKNLSNRYLCYIDLDGEVFSADFNNIENCFSLAMNNACKPFLAQKLCVSAYLYDFIKEEKQDAKWQEFQRDNFDYIENTPLTSVKENGDKNWKFPFDHLTDGNEVISVSGPVDEKGKYLDKINPLSKNYFFAKPKYNRYSGELLKIKWAYAYYDKNDNIIKIKKKIASSNPFCYQMTNQNEVINNGLNQMNCNFHNDKTIAYIKVYAFFNTPSENASIQIKTNNEFVNKNPKITDWYWCDRFGDKVIKAGYDSEIFICIESEGCKNTTLTINVFDQDSIYNDPISFTNNSITLYSNKSYIKFPVSKKRLQAETGENDSELIFSISSNTESIPIVKKDIQILKLVDDEIILDSFFATKTSKELIDPDKKGEKDAYYNKKIRGSFGSTNYIVTKIINNSGRKVKNIIYHSMNGIDPIIRTLHKGKIKIQLESEPNEYGLALTEFRFLPKYGSNNSLSLYINSTIKGWFTDKNYIKDGYFDLSGSFGKYEDFINYDLTSSKSIQEKNSVYASLIISAEELGLLEFSPEGKKNFKSGYGGTKDTFIKIRDGKKVGNGKVLGKNKVGYFDPTVQEVPIIKVLYEVVKNKTEGWIKKGSKSDYIKIRLGSFMVWNTTNNTKTRISGTLRDSNHGVRAKAIDINQYNGQSFTSKGAVEMVLEILENLPVGTYEIGMPFQGDFYPTNAAKGKHHTTKHTDNTWVYKQLKSKRLRRQIQEMIEQGYSLKIITDFKNHLHFAIGSGHPKSSYASK